jgi:cell division transport system ATP-binding protein
MIRLESVSLRYGSGTPRQTEVLHDLTFHVPEGGFRWLMGPSGAGKTSLMRMIYLAVRPTRGRLFIQGTDIGRTAR